MAGRTCYYTDAGEKSDNPNAWTGVFFECVDCKHRTDNPKADRPCTGKASRTPPSGGRLMGAADLSECPNRAGSCRCDPKCACGYGEHMTIHGPFLGEPPGSRPWGHEFAPWSREASPTPKESTP